MVFHLTPLLHCETLETIANDDYRPLSSTHCDGNTFKTYSQMAKDASLMKAGKFLLSHTIEIFLDVQFAGTLFVSAEKLFLQDASNFHQFEQQ